MANLRRSLLTALPKVLLSRITGAVTRIPLPLGLRGPVYRRFSRRYGVALDEMAGELADYPSLAAFFRRPLRTGTRPIAAEAPIVWPNDGKVVTTGPIRGDRIEQVKGVDYGIGELLLDPDLAGGLAGGSQATLYLAPGDYHRVHAPFSAELEREHHIPGTLFPVNLPTGRAISDLFARNERVVFRFRLPDGRPAAVVMVAALNVGDIHRTLRPPAPVRPGDEIGRFGFGSTTIVLLPPGTPRFAEVEPETTVRMGEAAPLAEAEPVS